MPVDDPFAPRPSPDRSPGAGGNAPDAPRTTRRVPGRHVEAEALATDPALDLVLSRTHPTRLLIIGLALLVAGLAALIWLIASWDDLRAAIDGAAGRNHPLNGMFGLGVLAIIAGGITLAVWGVGTPRLHDRSSGAALVQLHRGDWPMPRAQAWAFRDRLATLDPRLLEPPPRATTRVPSRMRAVDSSMHEAARIAVYDDPAARRAYVAVVHTLAAGSPAQAYPSIVCEGEAYTDLKGFALRGFRTGRLRPAERTHLEERYGPLRLM